jgi:flagellar hook-associated protein 3 FlgL
MDQIQSLAAQGESGTNTADTRSNIATQLGAALTNLVSLANTAAGGRYVFSGDSDQVKPYSIDLTQATPVSTYQGTPATRQVETPDGSQISVAMTAQQIFDGPTPETNVFGAVTALLTAMQNNDQAGIDAAMPQVSSAASYLNRQLASYGSIQNQVSNAIADGQQESVQLATQLNTIQGADLAQAIEQLNQANLQQQAVLGAQSQLSRKSLFDYLG